jgi:type IV pilus assembly protein PilV
MLSKIRKSGQASGFTLLEVLIAVTVIGVGFMAAASMQGTSISGNSRSAFMTAATYLAEDKLEELRNTDYMAITAAGSPENNIDELGNAGGIYSRSWTVVNDSPGLLMKEVTVTVDWVERGVSHTLAITTVIWG